MDTKFGARASDGKTLMERNGERLLTRCAAYASLISIPTYPHPSGGVSMDQAATRRPRHAQSAEVRAGEFAEIERLWIGSEEELDLSHPSVEGYSSLLMPHRLQIAEISATGERERERLSSGPTLDGSAWKCGR